MRRLALVLSVLAATGVVPSAAGAVLPGPNGPLVFTSGRDDGLITLSDSHAQIWFLSGPNGSAERLTTLGLSHHRHASWSPDRTKIAYARGPVDANPFDGPWDIYVQDLTAPDSAPVNITNTLDQNEDRPTWSPDGTRIAYAGQDAPASTSWDIWVKTPTPGGAPLRIADDASAGMGSSGQFSRPQWSPDGQEIFYGKIIAVTPQNYDIYRAGADGSDVATGGTPIVAGSANTYQAAVSPDGLQLCFTLQDPMTGKDVYTVSSTPGGSPAPRTSTSGTDEYECAWSPDGTKIAFVRGAFGAGEILMVDSSGSMATSPVANVAGRFDGNPEWTRNPSPTCSDVSASVAFNSFVSIPLPCADTPDPPDFTPNNPFGPDIVTPPAHGVLGGISNDSVIYTPNVNFQGQDSFTFKSDDGTSDSNIATARITVAGPGAGPGGGGGGGGPTPTCRGRTATIFGTAGADVLAGTPGRDVIAALGGNDTVRGGRGNDLICAGSGRDRVAGGRRNDRVFGGTGADRLLGNDGNDILNGQGGRDRLNGGRGRDRLNGGAARDVCRGSLGTDRASRCEVRIGIP